MSDAKVAFVGLGAMGGAMAARLLETGHHLTVYNRTASRCTGLAERGAAVAASPREAATGADLVFLCLAADDAVESLLFGEGGVVEGLAAGGIVTDLSTVAPGFARRCATRLATTGHHALDACVLGSPRHARGGDLRFLVGGDQHDVAVATPVLCHLATDIVHLGSHGMGTTAKLALQLLKGVQMQSLAEAIVFGERAGLDRQVLIDLIAASGFSSPVMTVRSGVMARRSFDQQPNFRLDLMRKDLGLVLAECQRLGVPVPATSASHESLTAAANRGLGGLDCAAVLAFMETVSGLPDYAWPGSTGE
jgi:3-hydroxyisobutyrate dehydrogenase